MPAPYDDPPAAGPAVRVLGEVEVVLDGERVRRRRAAPGRAAGPAGRGGRTQRAGRAAGRPAVGRGAAGQRGRRAPGRRSPSCAASSSPGGRRAARRRCWSPAPAATPWTCLPGRSTPPGSRRCSTAPGRPPSPPRPRPAWSRRSTSGEGRRTAGSRALAPALATEARRLDELRWSAVERLWDVRLGAGRPRGGGAGAPGPGRGGAAARGAVAAARARALPRRAARPRRWRRCGRCASGWPTSSASTRASRCAGWSRTCCARTPPWTWPRRRARLLRPTSRLPTTRSRCRAASRCWSSTARLVGAGPRRPRRGAAGVGRRGHRQDPVLPGGRRPGGRGRAHGRLGDLGAGGRPAAVGLAAGVRRRCRSAAHALAAGGDEPDSASTVFRLADEVGDALRGAAASAWCSTTSTGPTPTATGCCAGSSRRSARCRRCSSSPAARWRPTRDPEAAHTLGAVARSDAHRVDLRGLDRDGVAAQVQEALGPRGGPLGGGRAARAHRRQPVLRPRDGPGPGPDRGARGQRASTTGAACRPGCATSYATGSPGCRRRSAGR